MLKAVNNQSSPKKSKQGLCLLVACERVGGKEKIKLTSVEMPWVFILKKHRCPILFPHRGSLHSREEDIFHPRARPRPAQMRWHPSVPCVPRSMAMAGTSRCRCSLDVAVPTGGRRRNAGTTERGTDRKKIPHRPVGFRDGFTGVGTPVKPSRGVPTTNRQRPASSSSSRIITHLAEATG